MRCYIISPIKTRIRAVTTGLALENGSHLAIKNNESAKEDGNKGI